MRGSATPSPSLARAWPLPQSFVVVTLTRPQVIQWEHSSRCTHALRLAAALICDKEYVNTAFKAIDHTTI